MVKYTRNYEYLELRYECCVFLCSLFGLALRGRCFFPGGCGQTHYLVRTA